MTSDEAIDRLVAAVQARDDAEADLHRATDDLWYAAREAIASGAGVSHIARASGLSRTAVYKYAK